MIFLNIKSIHRVLFLILKLKIRVHGCVKNLNRTVENIMLHFLQLVGANA